MSFYKNPKQLKDQISLLRFKIQQSKLHRTLSLDKVQKDTFDINLSQIDVIDLKKYLCDLHTLILKLYEYSQNHNQKERQLLYDMQTAIKFAQIMRQNLMKPLSAQQFTESQARQYRVLLNIYLQSQSNTKNKSPQKDSYFQSISQIQQYNSKLQEKITQINKQKQQFQASKSLSQKNKLLQSENEYLKKQNQLTSARMNNYLSLKILTQSQELYIKNQKEEIQLKRQQIYQHIEENKRLKEKLYIYGEGDRKASEEVKIIKTNFFQYFSNKKKNYESNNTQ